MEGDRLARLEVSKKHERGVTSSSKIYFWNEQLRLTKPLLHQTARVLKTTRKPKTARVCRTARVFGTVRVCRTARVCRTTQALNSAGVQNSARVQNSAGPQQHPVIMAGPKEKLPKFDGDGAADPIRHCKTCETIWRANGITDPNKWIQQFPAILRGVAIDWFTDTDPQKLNSWDNIKEFIAEFQLLRDDNEIVVEILNTKQKKNETVRVFARRLKDLINKMENKLADGLQKRWFIEGLHPKLRRKMKIVPPSTYIEAYNRAMNLESEQKTKKKKKSSSFDSNDDEPSGEDSSDDEGNNKKVRAL